MFLAIFGGFGVRGGFVGLGGRVVRMYGARVVFI